jgi:hypothetical protein
MKPLSLLAAGLLLAVSVSPAQSAGQPNSPAAAPKASPAVELPIPESVFNIPISPRQGRNPFFPNSSAAVPLVKSNSPAVDVSTLLALNGITSPPKRMAMINGRSFEPGEAGDVKLPNGVRIPIKCLEIQDDRAIILLNGQRKELQLRSK